MSDKLEEFLAGHDWKLIRELKGWQVERDEVATDIIRLTLPARDGQRFTVRFLCDNYPEAAPGVTFITADGSTAERSAWPAGNDSFYQVVKLPPASFLCTDLTREGFAHHPDWASRATAWKGDKRTLMDLFNYIQDELLNSPNYIGRAN